MADMEAEEFIGCRSKVIRARVLATDIPILVERIDGRLVRECVLAQEGFDPLLVLRHLRH